MPAFDLNRFLDGARVPLQGAAEIFLVSANMMREQILPSCRLHYYVADGGHAVNTIPDYAKVVFRFRGPNAAVVAEGIEWVKDMAKGAALATQTKEKTQVITGLYDLLPNNVLAAPIPFWMPRRECTPKT